MLPTASSTRGAASTIGARAQRNLSDCIANLRTVWDRGGDLEAELRVTASR
jgi:hypothetical protein